MDDDALEREAIWTAIRTAQSVAIATQDILRALIIDVAQERSDPEGYLASLYERVIQPLEPKGADLQRPERRVYGEARELIGRIFSAGLQSLRNPSTSSPT
jgi:hypothetical protein